MSLTGKADGHISRQSTSYRQGLVLGLTMAEVMILLVFCLLIALATFLKTERDARQKAEEQLRQEREAALANSDFVEQIKKDPGLTELLKNRSAADGQGKLDEFWRELVEGGSVLSAAKRSGLTASDMRSHITDIKAIKDGKLDPGKAARDAKIAAVVDKVAPGALPDRIAALIERGLATPISAPKPESERHKWPPIIALSDANGRFFKSGSAEVDSEFKALLLNSTAPHIAKLIKEYKDYDIDVIEVVGHTDEQPIGNRPSNLDRDLVSVLRGGASIAGITPADNAGLGLARAVSVVGILRQSQELAGYKILPLSGGQLVNTNETLALGDNPGNVRERRRIEIRLRKTTPHVTDQPLKRSTTQTAAEPVNVAPLPPPKPAGASFWSPPFASGPMQTIPSLFPPTIFSQPGR